MLLCATASGVVVAINLTAITAAAGGADDAADAAVRVASATATSAPVTSLCHLVDQRCLFVGRADGDVVLLAYDLSPVAEWTVNSGRRSGVGDAGGGSVVGVVAATHGSHTFVWVCSQQPAATGATWRTRAATAGKAAAARGDGGA